MLKKVKRDTASRDTGDTELSKIKLKKTRDWKVKLATAFLRHCMCA